jgi:hypothetical protein
LRGFLNDTNWYQFNAGIPHGMNVRSERIQKLPGLAKHELL